MSILYYVDDTILLDKANRKNIMASKSLMKSFELFPIFKVNFFKSSFGVFELEKSIIGDCVEKLNYGILKFPSTYLELLYERRRYGNLFLKNV